MILRRQQEILLARYFLRHICQFQLPSSVALSRTIQRSRNRNNVPPPNPVTIDSLVIPSEYTLTLCNLPFLLYDSKNNENCDINNRILIFTTNENLNILNDSKIWFADDTICTQYIQSTVYYSR